MTTTLTQEEKRQRLWEEIATEISQAITAVLIRRNAEIKKQRKSADLLAFWIHEGARQATRRMREERK